MCNSWRVVLALSLCLQAAPARSMAQGTGCTVAPDIFQNWKTATVGSGKSDQELEARIQSVRGQVQQRPDRFTQLWSMDSIQLAAAHERRVWKEDSLMVIVSFSPSPELLVVPRTE